MACPDVRRYVGYRSCGAERVGRSAPAAERAVSCSSSSTAATFNQVPGSIEARLVPGRRNAKGSQRVTANDRHHWARVNDTTTCFPPNRVLPWMPWLQGIELRGSVPLGLVRTNHNWAL